MDNVVAKSRIGQVQALEDRIEVVIGRIMAGLRRGERMPPCAAASNACNGATL